MKKNESHTPITVPVVEEALQISKEEVVSGEVRIDKRVEETIEQLDVDLDSNHVEVDRIAINRYVDVAPAVRHEGDKMIIPVLKEVLIVEKKLMLVEEVHVYKHRTTETHREEVTLRKEHVEIRRTRPDE